MRLHVIDLGWLEYVTLCGFGRYRKTPLFFMVVYYELSNATEQ